MTRRRSFSNVLGPLEADVMEVAWSRGEVTVRDVHAELEKSRAIAYTTVMTTVSRLCDKGLLRRTATRRAHHYEPRLSREQYAAPAVKSVLDWLVTQFPHPGVAYFLDRVEEADPELLDAVVAAIEAREEDD